VARKPYDAREISIRLELELIQDFGETALAIARNLILGSPVGNPDLWQFPDSAPPGYVGGHFRRNWIVSIGGFNEAEIEGTDKAGASTVAAAKNEIRRYQNRRRIGPNLVIQNNVPYANRLAQGHSTQAEAGWVDEQIAAGLTIPGGQKDLD
jgi:hypothetical protein